MPKPGIDRKRLRVTRVATLVLVILGDLGLVGVPTGLSGISAAASTAGPPHVTSLPGQRIQPSASTTFSRPQKAPTAKRATRTRTPEAAVAPKASPQRSSFSQRLAGAPLGGPQGGSGVSVSNAYSSVTTNQATLANSDGVTWTDLADSTGSGVSVAVEPPFSATALITASADLFTNTAGINQDLAVAVSPTPVGFSSQQVAWKESGGYTPYKPNATLVQAVVPLTAGIPYTIKLQWKSNTANSASIFAGAGSSAPYSPTSLDVLLSCIAGTTSCPSGSTNPPLSVSTPNGDGQFVLNGPGGTSWGGVQDGSGDTFPTLTYNDPSSGGFTGQAVVTANADVFSFGGGSVGGPNQDIGLFEQVDGGSFSLIGWEENGGATLMNPIAFMVQGTPTLNPGHSYVFELQWKAGSALASGQSLRIGAGQSPSFSPTRMTLIMPTGNPAPTASGDVTSSQPTLSNSDGSTWADVSGSVLDFSPGSAPSTNGIAFLNANASAFSNTTSANVDIGIFVSVSGGPDTLLAWTEAGSAVAYNPDAAYLQYAFNVAQGKSYTFKLKWKSNVPMSGTMYLGAGGNPYSDTSLVAYFAPGAVAPTVTGVSPETGSTAGGTPVTLTGTNFVPGTGSTSLALGAIGVTPSSVTDNGTSLTFVTPVDTPDQVPVTVTTGGASNTASITAMYQYVAPGPVIPVVPNAEICNTGSSDNNNQCWVGPNGQVILANTSLNIYATGIGGVPSTGVSAVVLTVTAYSSQSSGYLTVYPTGLAVPNPGTTLNGDSNGYIANQVQVPVGANGQVSIYAGGSSSGVVVDVDGYVATPPSSNYAGQLVPLTPTRICDTRSGRGYQCSGSQIPANGSIAVTVLGAGGVPASGVSAVQLDVSALSPGASGNMIVYPYNGTQPATNNLSYTQGTSIADRVLVAPGANGKVTFYNKASSAIDALIDVDGYYTDSTATSNHGEWAGVGATRICDTRSTAFAGCGQGHIGAGQTLSVQVSGLGGVPSSASVLSAVAVDVSIWNASAATSITVFQNGASQPQTQDQQIASSAAAPVSILTPDVQLSSAGKLSVYNAAGNIDVSVDVVGYYTANGAMILPTVAKSILSQPDNGNLYGKGESIHWQVVISNPSATQELSVAGVTDGMDTALLHGGPPKIDGSSCPTGGITCVVGNGYIQLSGFTLGYPGDPNNLATSHTLTYYTAVGGKDVQCSGDNNTAVVSIGAVAVPSQAWQTTACDAGLGMESWWSYVTRTVDPQQAANVNVANGNLVLTAQDSTPIQSHGAFDFVLQRSYNSQDSAGAQTTDVKGSNGGRNGNGNGVLQPQGMGNGWQFNIDDLSASAAGPGLGSSLGLLVPNNDAPNSPSAVTFVDAEGTRTVYQFAGLTSNGQDITNPGQANGILHSLYPKVLQLDGNSHNGTRYTNLCVDESFTSPPGLHLSLFRYMETVNSCTNPGSTLAPATLGFEAINADGTRYEFSWDGHLLAMVDAAGNQLTYTWANFMSQNPGNAAWNKATLGALESISDSAGRAYAFTSTTWTGGQPETDITDPAGRVTQYQFDNLTPQHLVNVVNVAAAGTTETETYTYNTNYTCGGSSSSPQYQNLLCSITDQPRGTTFSFTYTQSAADSGGLPGYFPYVATMTDRNGNRTKISYYNNPQFVTADEGGERVAYSNIDGSGRVGEIDQGTPAANGAISPDLRRTTYTWDSAGHTCRQPDNVVDNDLCSTTVQSLSSSTPNATTSYLYNPEGQVLDEHQSVGTNQSIDTTYGYHTQIFEAGASGPTVHCWDATVAGSGAVTSAPDPATAACPGGVFRTDNYTLYVISTKTQALSPRGNAAWTNFTPYLTTYLVDDNSTVAPNYTPNFASPSTQICANPSSPTSNTGKLCEVLAPSFDNGAHANTVTQYTYDGYGQKNSMQSPKVVAEGGNPTTYTYYPDTQKDYANHTSMGGWMQGVTDPTGQFVAFAYDAAGNVIRSWSRDATAVNAPATLSSYPGTNAGAAPAGYSQMLYATSVTGTPGRYELSTTDPLGNTTSYAVDADGNHTTITPPRGNASSSNAYTVTQGFDGNDNLVCGLEPAEANGYSCASLYTGSSSLGTLQPSPPARAAVQIYDAFNHAVLKQDTECGFTAYQYDTANRLTTALVARGPNGTVSAGSCNMSGTTSVSGANCRVAGSNDAPMPQSEELCASVTSYDGEGNVLAAQDGNGQSTYFNYDALGHVLLESVPRNNNNIASVYTGYQYDADGNVVDTCSPRQYQEFGLSASVGACATTNSTPYAETISTYDVAGRLSTSTTERNWGLVYTSGSPSAAVLTTTYTHDADGNKATVTDSGAYRTQYTYNILDRESTMAVPRDHNSTYETTSYLYDQSGNETSATAPNNTITAWSYDADNRLVLTVKGSSNTSAQNAGPVDSQGGTNITTKNVYDPDGHIIGQFGPGAFTSSGSPDPGYLVRTDFDVDGRPIAQVQPRYDATSGFGDPGLGSPDTQTQQCTTTVPAFPQGRSWGLPAYASGTGVCVSNVKYDPSTDANGNSVVNSVSNTNLATVEVLLPTSTSSDAYPFLLYSKTEDGLTGSTTAPDPSRSAGARVAAETTAYDGDGQAVSDTDANGLTTTTGYTSDGLVAQVTTNTTAHQAMYSYDANGDQTMVNDGVTGQTTATAFSSDGMDTQVTDGAGDTTATYHNEPARSEQVFSPDAWVASNSNPAWGGSNGKGAPTVNTYTGDGLLATQTMPVVVTTAGPQLQQQLSYGYDQAGWKTQQTTSSVNAGGQPTAVGQLDFAYYNDGRQKAEQAYYEPNNTGLQTITSQYAPAGQATSVQDSTAGTTVTAGYYLDGLVRTANDGNRSQTYSYDGLGQEVARQDTNGSSNYVSTYAYEDSENLASMTAAGENAATTTWAYDAGGRQTQQVDNGNGLYLNYQYGNDGANGVDGTMTAETYGSASTVQGGWCYGDNAAFQITSQTFGTGSSPCTLNNITFSYGYDSAERVNNFTNSGGALHCTGGCGIGHDAEGNRTSYTDPASGNATTYAYNANDSICQAAPSGAACGGTATGYANFTYSSGFDQLSSVATSSTTVSSYCYDVFGRMSDELQSGSVNCGSPSAATSKYTYDGLDRQISHRDPNASGATAVHYDGTSTRLVTEDISGQSQETLYALSPTGKPLGLMYEGNAGSTQYLVQDGSGQTSAVFGSGTTPTCGELYDPFGTQEMAASLSSCTQTTGSSNGNTPNSYYYRTQRRDPGSGTYQLGSRTYDPSKGSFLTPDVYTAGPSGANVRVTEDPLTLDRYNYVNGDPINLVDPSGHDPWYEDLPGYSGPLVENTTADTGAFDVTPASQPNHYVASGCDTSCQTFVENANAEAYQNQQRQAELAAQLRGCWEAGVGQGVGRAIAPTCAGFESPQERNFDSFMSFVSSVDQGYENATKIPVVGWVIRNAPSIATGLAVFAGCEALTGAETLGLSTAGCGAAASAAGNALQQYAYTGSVDVSQVGLSALIGAVGAPVLGKVSGSVGLVFRSGPAADATGDGIRIADWSGYPESLLKPTGPFNLLSGDEYAAARAAANSANRALRAEADGGLDGLQIHEIQPVKWGGDPTDIANKLAIPPELHYEVTAWWNALQRALEAGGG